MEQPVAYQTPYGNSPIPPLHILSSGSQTEPRPTLPQLQLLPQHAHEPFTPLELHRVNNHPAQTVRSTPVNARNQAPAMFSAPLALAEARSQSEIQYTTALPSSALPIPGNRSSHHIPVSVYPHHQNQSMNSYAAPLQTSGIPNLLNLSNFSVSNSQSTPKNPLFGSNPQPPSQTAGPNGPNGPGMPGSNGSPVLSPELVNSRNARKSFSSPTGQSAFQSKPSISGSRSALRSAAHIDQNGPNSFRPQVSTYDFRASNDNMTQCVESSPYYGAGHSRSAPFDQSHGPNDFNESNDSGSTHEGAGSPLRRVSTSQFDRHKKMRVYPVMFPAYEIPVSITPEIAEGQELPRPTDIKTRRYATSVDERNFLTVCEYTINDKTITWDYYTGYVHLTGLWKAIGNSKADIVKLLDNSPELEPLLKRVRGGFLKIQGTWVPYNIARQLARKVCYRIRYSLIPVFGVKFPSECLTPDEPGFGQLHLGQPTVPALGGHRHSRRSTEPTPESSEIKQIRLKRRQLKKRSRSIPNTSSRSSFSKSRQKSVHEMRLSGSAIRSSFTDSTAKSTLIMDDELPTHEWALESSDDESADGIEDPEGSTGKVGSPPPMPRKLSFKDEAHVSGSPNELVEMLQATRSLQLLSSGSMTNKWTANHLGGPFECAGRHFHWDGSSQLQVIKSPDGNIKPSSVPSAKDPQKSLPYTLHNQLNLHDNIGHGRPPSPPSQSASPSHASGHGMSHQPSKANLKQSASHSRLSPPAHGQPGELDIIVERPEYAHPPRPSSPPETDDIPSRRISQSSNTVIGYGLGVGLTGTPSLSPPVHKFVAPPQYLPPHLPVSSENGKHTTSEVNKSPKTITENPARLQPMLSSNSTNNPNVKLQLPSIATVFGQNIPSG